MPDQSSVTLFKLYSSIILRRSDEDPIAGFTLPTSTAHIMVTGSDLLQYQLQRGAPAARSSREVIRLQKKIQV